MQHQTILKLNRQSAIAQRSPISQLRLSCPKQIGRCYFQLLSRRLLCVRPVSIGAAPSLPLVPAPSLAKRWWQKMPAHLKAKISLMKPSPNRFLIQRKTDNAYESRASSNKKPPRPRWLRGFL